MSAEGILTVARPDGATLHCKDAQGFWVVDGSAISAIQVGTLKYGHYRWHVNDDRLRFADRGGRLRRAGWHHRRDVARVDRKHLVGRGSWFVTSKLSIQAGAPATVRCQLQLTGLVDQGRVILDTGNNLYNWLDMSLTRKLERDVQCRGLVQPVGRPARRRVLRSQDLRPEGRDADRHAARIAPASAGENGGGALRRARRVGVLEQRPGRAVRCCANRRRA